MPEIARIQREIHYDGRPDVYVYVPDGRTPAWRVYGGWTTRTGAKRAAERDGFEVNGPTTNVFIVAPIRKAA